MKLLGEGGSISAYRANRMFGLGPAKDSWAERLEHEIEKKFKVKHAVACNSGTAALHMALSCLDLRGGEVVTSPYTFSATVAAILHSGGKPVFADVDPYTYCITKETVKHVITKKTKAILPVSLFGYRPDYRGLAGLDIPVVEDGCQAVGATRNGKVLQSVCLSQALSFNGGKNIPAGEGGALVTNSENVAEKARLLMNHGENYRKETVGYNYRMNELTACVAWHGLMELEGRNNRRRELAGILCGILDSEASAHISFDFEPFGSHVFYVYPFLLHRFNRREFASRLRTMGIDIGGGYLTPPLHHHKAFRKYCRRELPVVDKLSFKTLCILTQVRPPSTEEDMRYMAKSIQEVLEK